MEKIITIEEQVNQILSTPIEYYAEFLPSTGRVFKVGPSPAFEKNAKNIILIDNETAHSILTGVVKLSDCFVDVRAGKFEVVKDKSLKNIDNLLNRVVDIEWSSIDKPDVFIQYDDNNLVIELSEELGGTYKLSEKYQPIDIKKVLWAENTLMSFLITDYNDPHYVHKNLNLKLKDLQKGPVIFSNITFIKKQHSLYTKRIFENYVMEVK